MKNIIFWLLGALFTCLIIFVMINFVVGHFKTGAASAPTNSNVSTSTADTNTETPYATLMKSNDSFIKAESFMKLGDYTSALAAYKTALPSASDVAQQAQIEFDIANATARSGDVIGAIQIFKQIAANTSYTPIMRAYAVEYMGRQYYAGLNPAVTTEIFKDDPYKSFFVSNDLALSYRRLFEYGSSFYPLAESELYIADWYASRITTLYQTSSSSPEIATDMAIINKNFKNADADIQRTKNDPNASQLIPEALMRKAITLSKLAYIGMASSTSVESAFKTALVAYGGLGSTNGFDGPVRYYYALFLAHKYGVNRLADIEALLKPLYTDPGHNQFMMTAFLRNIRTLNVQNPNRFKDVQYLARFDPGFKSFLVSLGWKPADFTK